MKLLKLRKIFAKESLARARKRINMRLRNDAKMFILTGVFSEAEHGYERDWMKNAK